ncbi:CLUMA_CG014100, isoform A [Clunio marinus]|uniref:CLUMA_CG014100, isoform A n=1 Tax=Clunio marinus TaxID=568069 RepID=A0A1J1IQT9_9DIPT|nr:CLUMA_CG014100, isoform A [Clunio marinus]
MEFDAIIRSFYKKHWQIIASQIRSVNEIQCPKRGFLFDCGVTNKETLIDLLTKLKVNKLISKQIIVAAVKEDFFILNIEKFYQKDSHIFVDVSGSLEKPGNFKLNDFNIEKHLEVIRKQIISFENDLFVDLEISEEYCVPTIFGYLINYPVLYYYNDENDRNCLSLVDLKVFQIIRDDEILISFSIPCEIFDQNKEIQEKISFWLHHFQSHDEFEVKQFFTNNPIIILHERDEEARAFFEQACENDHRNLRAYQNLQNIKNKMARWHFKMLNDSSRNLSFKRAIQYWIKNGDGIIDVMDIGSGTGLLSMYATNVAKVKTKVKNIYAIEFSQIMADISAESLSTTEILMNDMFLEYLFLGNLRLISKRDEPYDADYVEKISDFKLVTKTVETIEVNFNNLESMEKYFNGKIIKECQLESEVNNDYIDGFVVWFSLYLNEMEPENIISTKPKSGSCWTQAIFKLKQRVLLQMYQIVKISVSCKEGVLKIDRDLDINSDLVDIEVDSNILKFLNDEEYLQELEFSVSKHKSKIINCLDFSVFPYVGLVLLKEGRIEKLWCRKKDELLVKEIASRNVIKESGFEFIDESMIDRLNIKFELIILHPFLSLGDLDNQMVCNFAKYRKLQADGGLLIPNKVTLFGELINSDWLISSCRITDADVKRLKIDKFINQFATEVHLDLDNSLECEKLTSAFKISEISLDDELHESSLEVPLRNTNLPIHAIFYHHKIQLTRATNDFVTNRKSKTSCFKRTAQVLNSELIIDGATVKISFTQNFGIVKCDVLTTC